MHDYWSEGALKELHGSFMVVSWLIAASIGILMPRYMKKSWVGKQILGKDRWFVVSFNSIHCLLLLSKQFD